MARGIEIALEKGARPLDLAVENVVHRKIAESPGVGELNKNKVLDSPFGGVCDRMG